MLLEMNELIPVHVGLLGHIDHGKTEIARALSEKISTAGLDKHPQSKRRGITIDLGFTMFTLDNYLVTLVDAPGHADLIRSVIAGANIIDAAILVIAADEGPKVQTGEHLIVLQSLGIERLIVALSKIDLVEPKQLDTLQDEIKRLMVSAGYPESQIVPISAITETGIPDLKDALAEILKPSNRLVEALFMMPIDHAFPKKGYGTVLTGTVLRGEIQTNDTVQLVPHMKAAKIRSIQVFGETRRIANAGDRIGINIPDFDSSEIHRGDYLSVPNGMRVSKNLICSFDRNPLYKGRISQRMVVNAMIGMSSVTCEVIPITAENNEYFVGNEALSKTTYLALLLQTAIPIDTSMKILLMRTDLPPTAMRIMGSGKITDLPDIVRLKREKTRIGRISRLRDNDVLVEGLASDKIRSEHLIGKTVETEKGIRGEIKQPFGTRGVLAVTFDSEVQESQEVYYKRWIEEEYSFGH